MTELLLPVTGTLDVNHALAVLGIHSLPAQERLNTEARTVQRVLRLGEELVHTTLELGAHSVRVSTFEGADPGWLTGVINHWLGLTQDQVFAYAELARVPGLEGPTRLMPHLRLLSYPDPFEALATTILGQQISISAARTLAGRYVQSLGAPHPSGLRVFPTAEATAGVRPEDLQALIRCPRARAETLHRVAHWYAAEGQALLGSSDKFLESLFALRGVGPWTRDYMALRGLRLPDVFLKSDLVVRRALVARGLEDLVPADFPDGAGSLATVLLWALDAAGS